MNVIETVANKIMDQIHGDNRSRGTGDPVPEDLHDVKFSIHLLLEHLTNFVQKVINWYSNNVAKRKNPPEKKKADKMDFSI
jgi:hypothetical protein